ncbi:MAG: SAP domain-containing protein [Candidatus Omnitrophica bacterium]|nr:SAP domain-containing protein [Candidatus Omnitrophota bacterium]MDD5591694.1 SAP domain-containing protein [Candidatus Omnitrophota bacterium]
MRLIEIEKKARGLGVKDTWKYSKKDLIKTIQRKEGNFDCFATAKRGCDQLACCWRADCLK